MVKFKFTDTPLREKEYTKGEEYGFWKGMFWGFIIGFLLMLKISWKVYS